MPGFNEHKYTYSNRWYNKDIESRYKYVTKILEYYSKGQFEDSEKNEILCIEDDGLFDYEDLDFLLKEAFVGSVFFSSSLIEYVKKWGLDKKKSMNALFNRILGEERCYQILNNDDAFDCEGLGLCNSFRRLWNREIKKRSEEKEIQNKSEMSLRYEHVIPTAFYYNRIIELYKNGQFDLNVFKSMLKDISVCFILKKEDDELNEKKLKEKMPDGWRWGDDPFARYKKCGIKVWGQD
jgi:hypothetical protein